MNTRIKLSFLSLALWSVGAKSQTSTSSTTAGAATRSTDSPAISVDESNFKSIFSESIAEEGTRLKSKSRSFDAEVGASYTQIQKLSLSNNYFGVDYAEDFKSLMAVKTSASKSFWTWRGLQVSGIANLGYGMKEGSVTATSNRGSRFKDQITLQWLPLSAGVYAKQQIPNGSRFSVFLSPSIGSQYFHQSGNLDGINQGYWLPFVNARIGVNLFESRGTNLGAALDGLVLAGNLTRGFASGKNFQSWSADLGIRFSL